eukprot:TRINITY_DN23850_c0_g2_i5.p1 TRINITY_DN23850_c0_g2~~TRINITY_DN23850_c0_g2_i5.p1  ORF type:complete len:102 (+),score=15.13 TRINITY_DN23850_c0_g2_i5:565-870(+)
MRVTGTVLWLRNANPFILKDDSGEEKPSTKVWIDNVPIYVVDAEIEHSLVKVGCELRSAIKTERARDLDHRHPLFDRQTICFYNSSVCTPGEVIKSQFVYG